MKYLITGLGNIGEEYADTRHNIGFMILDAYSKVSNFVFKNKRYGFIAEHAYRGHKLYLLKPSTYVNLSGKAVNYWCKKLSISEENLLIIADDIALPFGDIRLRKKGSDGGHNGLMNIIEVLGTKEFARLRFGIGNDFNKGRQIDYVLGEWSEDELEILSGRIEKAIIIIQSFVFNGIDRTMNLYNNK